MRKNEDTKPHLRIRKLGLDEIIPHFDCGDRDLNDFIVNEKRLKSYPAAKLCRLGVDLSARGMHIGSYLMDFIKWYLTADNKTGCRFLTVDAYIAACPFYDRNGFLPLSSDDEGCTDTRLLYYDLSEIV